MFDDDGNPIAITNGVSPVYPCDTCRGFGDAPKAVRKAKFPPRIVCSYWPTSVFAIEKTAPDHSNSQAN
jgi:hypothetical protein